MSKKTLTDEELFAQFEDIPSSTPDATASKPAAAAKSTKAAPAADVAEDDPLAELSALTQAKPLSRPNTPRLSSSTTSGTTGPKVATPSSSDGASGRTSEDKPAARTVTDQQSAADTGNPTDAQAKAAAGAGGGWWGSVFTAASAAVKQAEAAVKDIRGNEEALKWATQQVRGNVDTLRAYGANARSLALPTFTNILQTIAPPISAHERLQIHTTHDILGYPSLDPMVYSVFARVMSQVEGGDLLVIQRGTESRARDRATSDIGYRGGVLGSNSGWTDGPWWRDARTKRDLSAVQGLVEGTKLARANAEAYATEFFAPKGGVEEAAKQATEILSESNPVRSSDIFLAIQAVQQTTDTLLFAEGQKVKDDADQGNVVEPAAKDDSTVAFAIFLHDPIHGIAFSTISQTIPAQWVSWMDADADDVNGLPESIREMIAAGGVDAREWVAEWMEEAMTLAIGVVAQRYVAKRMGVGEGGVGRGKGRIRAEEDAAGEAARAV